MTKKIPYSQFKHGQRCTCEIDGEKMTDTSIAIRENGMVGISYGGGYLRVLLKKDEEYKEGRNGITNLTLLPRTIEDVEEGDIIVDKEGFKYKVLGRTGSVIHTSHYDYHDLYGSARSVKGLQDRGYTIKQDTPLEEEQERKTWGDVSKLCKAILPLAEEYDRAQEKEENVCSNHSSDPCNCVMGIKEQKTEITMEEIASKFNIPLDQLRIKE